MTGIFKRQRFITVLAGGILLIYIFSLVGRHPHVDDAWLGEYAYWLAKSGFAKSELLRGITNHEIKLVVYHKLHAVLGAAFIQVFGFSLYALKSINLFFLIAFFTIYYRYFRINTYRNGLFLFALVLLFFHAAFFWYTFVFRPEIPAMTMGFLSFVLLYKTLKKNDNRLFVVLAGMSAAAAALFHLNGLIYIFAGFVVLMILGKYRWGLIFGTGATVILAFYFFDMTSPEDFSLWINQYSNSPHFGKKYDGPFILGILNRIGQEHMRYFHSPKEIAFSILLIVSLIFAAGKLKKQGILIIYTSLLAFALSAISIHKTSYYLILLLPWLVLLISLAFDHIVSVGKPVKFAGINVKKSLKLNIISSLIVIYLAVQLFYIAPVVINKNNLNDNLELIDQYISKPKDSLNIIAPMTHIFYGGITDYNRIQAEVSYNEMKKSDPTIYKTGFLDKAEEFDIDYIILSEFFIGHFGIDQLEEADLLAANYEMLHQSEGLVILKNHN